MCKEQVQLGRSTPYVGTTICTCLYRCGNSLPISSTECHLSLTYVACLKHTFLAIGVCRWLKPMSACWCEQATANAWRPLLILTVDVQLHLPTAHMPWIMLPFIGQCKYHSFDQICHDRCMYTLYGIALHCPMSLSKCTHVLSDVCMPWLLLAVIGRSSLLEHNMSWLMVPSIGRHCYRSANAPIPYSMSPCLGWCNLTLFDEAFQMWEDLK